MRQLIMTTPIYYKINGVDTGRAQWEWNNLRNNLIAAGADVIVCINPPKDAHYTAFTSRAGAIYKNLFITAHQKAEQAITGPYFKEWAKAHQYEIFDPKENSYESEIFQGSCDFIFDRARKMHWYGTSVQGSSLLAKTLIEKKLESEKDIFVTRLLLDKFMQLNHCFMPLDTGHCLWYPKAFNEQSRHKINFWFGDSAIEVSDEDAECLACDSISIGNTIIIPEVSNKLKRTLKEHKFKVVESPVNEFIKGSGGINSLTLDVIG